MVLAKAGAASWSRQSFKGHEQSTVADPVGGMFAHFIVCFLHKLLLNGKQMQTHQVCEQMVLLCDQGKNEGERGSEFNQIALAPSPIVCLVSSSASSR